MLKLISWEAKTNSSSRAVEGASGKGAFRSISAQLATFLALHASPGVYVLVQHSLPLWDAPCASEH